MRILVKADEKEYQVTCPVCGAELAYTNRDLHQLPSQVRHMGVPLVTAKCAVNCPECKTWTEVPAMASRRREVRKECDWE